MLSRLAPVYRYVSAVSVVGSALFVVFLMIGGIGYPDEARREFWILAGFVVLGEFLPITLPYRGEKEEITTSATFAFALLLKSGMLAAVMALALASVIADAARGKPLWKVEFNLSQYTLSLAAAGIVLMWTGHGAVFGGSGQITAQQMPWIILAAVVYFLVNNTLAGAAIALAQGERVLRFLRRDLRFQATTAGVLLGLAPVVVVVGQTNHLLIVLAALPLVAVYKSVRATLESAQVQERFRSLVQNAGDLISILDDQGVIQYQSPSAQAVLGRAPESLEGTRLVDLAHPDDAPRVGAVLRDAVRTPGRTIKSEFRARGAAGGWVELEAIWNNLLDERSVRGVVVNARDMSERKALEQQLAHQAFHDPLTGLANRALFRDRVEHALARRERGGDPLGVVFLDLDDFKTVNDSLGHAAGDELLLAVGDRLRRLLRPADTAARFGGDEFAILLEGRTDRRGAVGVADRIVEALAAPFQIGGKEVFVRGSIGIAEPQPGDGGAEELMRNADVAMYMAKSDGKGRHKVFEPSMHAAVLERLELGADLRRAIDRDEFVLWYQPIFDLKRETIVGAEALVRWDRPGRGLVPPGSFIPLAEETGLIVPLGGWVLEEACRQAASWRELVPGGEDLLVSVNMSARQLQSPGFVGEVREALRATGLPPSGLLLEITESEIMQDVDAMIGRLREIKDLGVRLAIDDFGTGQSSLSYLKRFPVDVLKIDKSFIDEVAGDPESSAYARAIVKIGRTLRLQTLAEGIEDAAQLERLRTLGCHLGQGFHLAPPLDAEAMAGLLAAGAPVPAGPQEALPLFA